MINQKICQLAVSLGILPLCVYAEVCCPLIPGDPIEDCQVCPGYFYPARFDTSCSYNAIVTADFIYWAPDKQLNSYAIEQSVVGTTAQSHVITHQFGYRPGFKVGVGMGLPCFDNIVLNAEYLWFSHTTTSGHTASPGSFITPLNGIIPNPPPPQSVSSRVTSKWHLGLQMAELTIGRPFYIGQRLILSPSLGLKAMWVNQSQSVDFNLIAGGLGTERNTMRAWAIGPYLNINAKGLLGGGFYICVKAGMLNLYERITQNNFKADFPTLIPFQRDAFLDSKKPYIFPTFMETGIGFGWGNYFCENRYHVDVALTYDYFIALMLMHVVFGGNLLKDFYLHGLTVKGQLDF